MGFASLNPSYGLLQAGQSRVEAGFSLMQRNSRQ